MVSRFSALVYLPFWPCCNYIKHSRHIAIVSICHLNLSLCRWRSNLWTDDRKRREPKRQTTQCFTVFSRMGRTREGSRVLVESHLITVLERIGVKAAGDWIKCVREGWYWLSEDELNIIVLFIEIITEHEMVALALFSCYIMGTWVIFVCSCNDNLGMLFQIPNVTTEESRIQFSCVNWETISSLLKHCLEKTGSTNRATFSLKFMSWGNVKR